MKYYLIITATIFLILAAAIMFKETLTGDSLIRFYAFMLIFWITFVGYQILDKLDDKKQ